MERTVCRLPNFFLLGAGRCGTTSLYYMLREHPDIFLSDPKEPSFFCRPFQRVRDPISYAELFRDAGDAIAVGDASHVHFSNPEAAGAIRAFFPSARFVLIMRNPVERAFSLYCFMVREGYEPSRTFEKALVAEERRARNPQFSEKARHYDGNFMYFRSGLFGQQLQRYLEYYPRSAFHVTTLDRLSTHPDETLVGVQEFLGVRPIPTESVKANRRQGVRSATLQWLARRALERPVCMGIPGANRSYRRLREWNVRLEPPPIRQSTYDTLLERYADDLALLRRLSGVDLSR